MKEYLKKSLELARILLDKGEFTSGAVVVTKSGNIYESGNSVACNHGELQAIDAAIGVEGAPLKGAVLYTSMQPCIMCSTKAYWAGIRKVYYIIPKDAVRSEFCYSGTHKISEVVGKFHSKMEFVQDDTYLNEALSLYKQWEKKILKN